MDMIFAARQLVEKSCEQHRRLYVAFADLSKAFDSVDRELLLKILRKSGGTDYFTKLVGCLHDGMAVGTRVGEGIYLNRSKYHGG